MPSDGIIADHRLRFLIFHTPGKLVHHARRVLLRLPRALRRFSSWRWALEQLPLPPR